MAATAQVLTETEAATTTTLTTSPKKTRALTAAKAASEQASTEMEPKRTALKPTTTPKKYHTLRKSDAFTGPVIFLSWEDCLKYVDPSHADFWSFDNFVDALEFTASSSQAAKRPYEKRGEHPNEPNVSKKSKTATLLPDEEKDNDEEAGEQKTSMEKPKRPPTSAQRTTARRQKEREELTLQAEAARLKLQQVWEDNYELLKQYNEKHGSCNVVAENGMNTCLSVWLAEVYHEMHQFGLDPTGTHKNVTQERYQRLMDLGVETPQMKSDRAWEEKFERLSQFKFANGDCDVPNNDEDSELANWVTFMQHQIRQFEHKTAPAAMTQERYQRLKDLGVGVPRRKEYQNINVWSGVDKDTWWEEMFLELAAFKAKHGHTSIPRLPPSMLQNFATYQRKEYARLRQGKPSKLTKERIARLTGLGFELKSSRRRLTFEERAVEWLEYRTKYGCDPPSNHPGGLGAWMFQQRRRFRISKLGTNPKRAISQAQIEKLESLGFQWHNSPPSASTTNNKGTKACTWDERYAQLLEFVNDHGHSRVPKFHVGGLGGWTYFQRSQYKKFMEGAKSIITPERLAKLQQAGFDFDPRRNQGLQREQKCVIGHLDSGSDTEDGFGANDKGNFQHGKLPNEI
jgi:hypothetical protein